MRSCGGIDKLKKSFYKARNLILNTGSPEDEQLSNELQFIFISRLQTYIAKMYESINKQNFSQEEKTGQTRLAESMAVNTRWAGLEAKLRYIVRASHPADILITTNCISRELQLNYFENQILTKLIQGPKSKRWILTISTQIRTSQNKTLYKSVTGCKIKKTFTFKISLFKVSENEKCDIPQHSQKNHIGNIDHSTNPKSRTPTKYNLNKCLHGTTLYIKMRSFLYRNKFIRKSCRKGTPFSCPC